MGKLFWDAVVVVKSGVIVYNVTRGKIMITFQL